MILVFISRDDAEYNKYTCGCLDGIMQTAQCRLTESALQLKTEESKDIPDSGNPTADLLGKDEIIQSDIVINETDEIVNEAKKAGSEKPLNVQPDNVDYMISGRNLLEEFKRNAIQKAQEARLLVVVIRSGQKIVELKSRALSERYDGVNTRNLLSVVGQVLKDAVKFAPAISLCNQCVHLFVHWGGVTDLIREECKFESAIASNDYKKIIGCKELKFYEVSSRRDCFNVNGHEINIPYTQDEAEKLMQRFEEARGHDKILNLIMRIASEDGVDCSVDEFSQVRKFLSDDTRRTKLRFFALESPMKWLADWKPWKEFVGVNGDAEKAICEMFSPVFENPIPTDQSTRYKPNDKLRALFIQLLREGIVK